MLELELLVAEPPGTGKGLPVFGGGGGAAAAALELPLLVVDLGFFGSLSFLLS